MKEKISQVIVVEGRDDTANLKRYFDVETYETRGSAINDQDIERIQRLHQRHGVIVFTDPDFNGERIRRMIMTAIQQFSMPSSSEMKLFLSPRPRAVLWGLSMPAMKT